MGSAAFERFRRDFLGVGREDPVASLDGAGASRRRVYLDTAATALMPRLVHDALGAYASHALGNAHSSAHRAARITTREMAHVRAGLARFLGAHPERQVVLFTGNGATGALNRLAAALFPPEVRLLLRGGRSREPAVRELLKGLPAWAESRGAGGVETLRRRLVVASRMDHHSNILPWMRAVGASNLRFPRLTPDGCLDLDDLRRVLDDEGDRVRLVAIPGASNVTGTLTPVREVARLAHAAGASIVVDAAQWAPHAAVRMHDPSDPEGDIDYLALSGHKLYAPGSRGVLVTHRETFPGPDAVGDVGGGMADVASQHGFSASADVAQREEGGTPNLTGTIALGVVVEALASLGMAEVERHERELVGRGRELLARLDGVTLYGPDPERAPRVAVLPFNAGDLPHGFVAAALSDYCNVAVRNGSFCAQLYVRHLLGGGDAEALLDRPTGGCGTLPGMVRASCGIYTGEDDLEALADGLRFVMGSADRLVTRYRVGDAGEFVHEPPVGMPAFSVAAEVERRLGP